MRILHTRNILVSLLLMAGLATATTVIPLSVETLALNSSHVLEGQATQSWSEWNQQHTMIFTYTKFQVLRALKGSAPGVVVVKQMGGSAEGYTQRVAGVRHWVSGEHAVLFLRPSMARDGTMEVTGLMQGNFLVRRAANGELTVSNGLPGVSAYEAASNRIAGYQGSALRLKDLESRVWKAVQP